jgi:hypothetical protein
VVDVLHDHIFEPIRHELITQHPKAEAVMDFAMYLEVMRDHGKVHPSDECLKRVRMALG